MSELFRNAESTICMKEELEKFDLGSKITILMNESKFQEALEHLQQLQPMQNDQAWKVNTQLMMSECQIKMGTPHAGAKELVQLITSAPVQPDDFKEAANNDIKREKYVRAFLLYFSASKLYKEKHSGDDAVQGIKACVQAVEKIVEEMIKQDEKVKKVISDNIIPALEEVTDDLSKIPNSGPRYRARLQAWCLQSIGLCYKHCGEHQRFADNVESAVQLLKRELKEDADKYHLLGVCLHSSGEAHENLDRKGKAMDMYERAIEAKEKANDWPSKQSEQESKELSREKLKIVKEFYEAKFDNSRNLMKESKFSEVLDVLREIEPMFRDEELKINAQLTAIECHMWMERARKVFREMDELANLMLSSRKTPDDVVKLASCDVTAELYVRGFLHYFSACKLYKEKSAGKDAVEGIRACVRAVQPFVEKMIKLDEKMKKIVTDYIIPALEEVTDDLSKIPNLNPRYLVKQHAWCLYRIGLCYYHSEDYQRYADANESAVELMRKELKEDAEKCNVLGRCYHNAGHAYSRLNQKVKSKELYGKALVVYSGVSDWPNEESKKKTIELTESNLKA